MIARIDTRTVLHSFFRQKLKFLCVFLSVLSAGILYVLCATPEYESTAKLLIKFGQDARFETSPAGGGIENIPADAHRQHIQSNVNILTSRDLAETLLKNMSVEHVYPGLAAHPPAYGTLMDAAIRKWSEDLIIKTENDSDIIHVGIYNPDPLTARTLLDNLIDLFIARQSEIYSNPQAMILRQQAQLAQKALQEAQKQLYDYKKQEGIVSVEEELSLLLKQRSNLKEELYHKERFYAHYQTHFVNSSADPDIDAIETQIAALDRQIAATVQRKSHYDDLMREIDIDEAHYKEAQKHWEDAEANQFMNQQKITRISVIEQPSLPYKPGRPWKAVIILLSLIAGVTLGLCICMIAEAMDESFSLPQQAETALGIPLLASFAYAENNLHRPSHGRR